MNWKTYNWGGLAMVIGVVLMATGTAAFMGGLVGWSWRLVFFGGEAMLVAGVIKAMQRRERSGMYMLVGAIFMAEAAVLATLGFIGGVIGVMFIAGLITLIVGVVKWRSQPVSHGGDRRTPTPPFLSRMRSGGQVKRWVSSFIIVSPSIYRYIPSVWYDGSRPGRDLHPYKTPDGALHSYSATGPPHWRRRRESNPRKRYCC